jgi:hypothetical protein
MRYGQLLMGVVALSLMAGPALAVGMIAGVADHATPHNNPIPVPAHAAQSPMGFNPVTTVAPGPTQTALPSPLNTTATAGAALSAGQPPVLMAPMPKGYPPRSDNQNAATMVPSATTMTAAQAALIPGVMDFASLCPANAAGNVDIHDCLVKAEADADTQLNEAQTKELQIARAGHDWQEGRKQAQLLSVSAMSFNAYRDSECLRQQQAAQPGQEQTGDIMLACQIRMTRARLSMLGQPDKDSATPQQSVAIAMPLPVTAPAIEAEAIAPAPLAPMDMTPLPPPSSEP